MAQPAPQGYRILVVVEPSLLVHDCAFVMENPAYFVANLYISRLFHYQRAPVDEGGGSNCSSTLATVLSIEPR